MKSRSHDGLAAKGLLQCLHLSEWVSEWVSEWHICISESPQQTRFYASHIHEFEKAIIFLNSSPEAIIYLVQKVLLYF